MDQTRGRALVAAFLKELRQQRGIEQEELARQFGVHKSTILRAESLSLRETSDKMEIAIAITRALGGDVAHVVLLRGQQLPEKYPLDRLGLKNRDEEAVTVEVAADVARWSVEQQDQRISELAHKRGAQIAGLAELTARYRWAAFRDPERALKVYL